MPITRDELGMDMTISIYDDTSIRVAPWDDENLLLVFGGPVQKIVIVLDRDDFQRLYEEMTSVVSGEAVPAEVAGERG
ncbi:hypothetical protein N8J89_09040 [Crossiella sp. CA-258035]|uniref:hypothetical protein n=1 Tax=Crossiella sp. CA-258035 TaxID=2981138 RepID=UPI0024BC79A0|nr:hypothetical protein [Crossiella sp. CA-258035]WHT21185.1 hypothetical protein N8J89_09040 [Crossiella sp. CA-258035]